MPRAKRDTTQADDLERDIAAMVRVASSAEENNAFSAAVQALSRLVSLRAELHRLRDLDQLAETDDALQRIKLTRRIAEREGSWQAVARLASVEADMEIRLAEAKAKEEEAKLSRLTTDDLVGMIEEAWSVLPANVRADLSARLAG